LTYLVPPTLLFLPLSRVVSKLGLGDRLWALILVYPSFTIPFAIWLLMGFFKAIPQELEDAALVDGCSRLGALVRIVLPVSLHGRSVPLARGKERKEGAHAGHHGSSGRGGDPHHPAGPPEEGRRRCGYARRRRLDCAVLVRGTAAVQGPLAQGGPVDHPVGSL